MKKLKFSSIFLLFCLILTTLAIPVQALADPELETEVAYLIDTNTQQVLYASNAEQSVSSFPLPQIVTVLLTLDAIDSGALFIYDAIVVPEDFDKNFASTAVRSGFAAGETVILESLLYCAILEQSDDACYILAYAVSGNVPAFVEQMNEYVEVLGCTGTQFRDPSSSTGESPHTTAKDTALILQKALSYPTFCILADTETYNLPETDKNASRPISVNRAFTSYMEPQYYSYADFFLTSPDKTAIFARAVNTNISLLAIVYGTESGNCYNTAASLFDWAFDNFQHSNVLTARDVIAELEVSMTSDGEKVKLCPDQPITLLIPRNETLDFDVQYTYRSDHLVAPLSKGTVLGEVKVLYGDVVYGTAKLVAANNIDRSNVQYLRSHFSNTLHQPFVLITLALVLLLLALYIRSVIHYRKHRRAYLIRNTAVSAKTPLQSLDVHTDEPVDATPTESSNVAEDVDFKSESDTDTPV